MITALAEILPHAARKYADRTALIIENRRFSFNELDALSNRVANGLIASGVNPGDRVTLVGPSCWEWLVSYYGIAKTGAILNPINVMLTSEEVRYAVADSGARAVIASSDKGAVLVDMAGVGNLSEVVLWGETPTAGASMLSDWLQLGKPDFTPLARKPADLAAICYTSGTTGFPKGAMQSHRAVIGAAVGTALMAARNAHDRVINALPLSHVYGSCVFNAAMMAGSTLILISAVQRGCRTKCNCQARRDFDGRRPYRLLLHARTRRFREVRSLQPHSLLGRWPDAASREIAGIHRAYGLSGARGLGNDGTGRRDCR